MKLVIAPLLALSLVAFSAHAKGAAAKLDCSEAKINPASDNYDENLRARCLGPEGKAAQAAERKANEAKAAQWKKSHPEAAKKEQERINKRLHKSHEEYRKAEEQKATRGRGSKKASSEE
jgi:hypothetical protein